MPITSHTITAVQHYYTQTHTPWPCTLVMMTLSTRPLQTSPEQSAPDNCCTDGRAGRTEHSVSSHNCQCVVTRSKPSSTDHKTQVERRMRHGVPLAWEDGNGCIPTMKELPTSANFMRKKKQKEIFSLVKINSTNLSL